MVLLRNQVICDKHPHLIVKGKVFLLSFCGVFLVHHNDTILHDIPGIQVDGDDVPYHLVLPIWIVSATENWNGLTRENSCKQHSLQHSRWLDQNTQSVGSA